MFKSPSTTFISFLAFLLTVSVPSLYAAQFTADVIQTKDGKTSKSKLYVRDTQYRMDMQERGTELFLLVDSREGITRVVFPADREYMEMETTSLQSLMNNPFASFRHGARQYERKEKGLESFKGFECSKVLVRSGEQDLFTALISEELNFPLKIAFHLQKGMSAELDNIQQGLVGQSLFKVPQDYTAMKGTGSGTAKKKKDQGPAREPWMDRVSSAAVLEPPVKKSDLEEGEIFRVQIERDKALSTFASGGVRIYAFKQGQPVVKFVYSGGRLQVYLSPKEADEIVLYNPSDSRFRDHARVKQGDMPERVLADGEEMRIRMKPGDESVARFVNMADSESKVYYTWLSQGTELLESELTPKRFRSKSLRAGQHFRSTYNQMEGKAPGDTLLVQVQKGRVLIKAGQPFQPKTVEDTVQKPAESKSEPAGTKEKSSPSVETTPKNKQKEGSAKAKPAETETAGQSASRAANIMFILDASGSMWGEVEGKDKIAIAKEVMAKLIRDLPDDTRAGVVAYGHRRKGDCKDVEELVQMSPLDREGIIRIIQGLSPKGKTPITYSVRVTAEKLRVLEDETTIILISDGRESCGGAPCTLVRELKESGLRFVMHVIGFDVTEEERKQLECMAKAGGGRYFTAKTAGDFEAAARKVVQDTRTVGFLEIMAFRNKTPVRALVEIFTEDTGQRVKKVNTFIDEKKPEMIRLKPGTYKVVFTDEELPGNPSRSFSDVKVELDQTVSRTARFDAGILELSAIKDGKSIHAHARLYKQDEAACSGWLEEGKGASFNLSPGVYRVEVTDKSIPEEPVVRLKDIEIRSGRSISRQANFSLEGILKIEALKAGKSIHVHARVYKGDERVASGWLDEGKGASFNLLPGLYRVELRDKKIPQAPMVVLENIEVQPGETVNRQARFLQEGKLRIEALKGGKSIHVHARVYKGDERVASGWLDEGEGASFKLLPGLYRVELRDKKIPQAPMVVLENIEVQPGETVNRQARFVQEGKLGIEAFKSGKSIHVYARVFKGEDRVVQGWLEEGKGKTFRLLPGTYRMEVKGPDGKTKEQKGISVKSGQTTQAAIDF